MAKETNQRNEGKTEQDRNTNPHDRLKENKTDQQKEGDYRNVETAVNRPESFDDEKETQMEDDLSKEASKSQEKSE